MMLRVLCTVRCIAISSLGVFLYQQVPADPHHPCIEETVQVLLTTLRVSITLVSTQLFLTSYPRRS